MNTRMNKLRLENDITQCELGEIVGVSHGWISQIENGKDNCPAWLAEKIAKALGTTLKDIFKKVVERDHRYVVKKK